MMKDNNLINFTLIKPKKCKFTTKYDLIITNDIIFDFINS